MPFVSREEAVKEAQQVCALINREIQSWPESNSFKGSTVQELTRLENIDGRRPLYIAKMHHADKTKEPLLVRLEFWFDAEQSTVSMASIRLFYQEDLYLATSQEKSAETDQAVRQEGGAM